MNYDSLVGGLDLLLMLLIRRFKT